MDKKFQNFLRGKLLPNIEEKIFWAQARVLELEFKIPKLEEKFQKLQETPVLAGSNWEKQLEKHNQEKKMAEDELNKAKQEKETLLKLVAEYKEFIEWLGQKAKKYNFL